MVKLADSARINRQEFIQEYQGYELDPTWLDRMALKAGRGWQALIERSREKVEELRAEMATVGQYVGVDITEFRRIVNMVQKGEREARHCQEGNGRGEPASGDLDRQEIHQPRPAIP
jgi:RNA polymerase primary sigma factor